MVTVTARPIAPPVNLAGIPATMREVKRWLGWRYVWRPGRKGKPGKWAKMPYTPATSAPADTTDPATWGTYAEARDAMARGSFDGIGFALGDGWAGVDFDDCRNPATGQLSAFTTTWVGRLSSYTEVSPSGTGVKVVCFGTLPDGGRRRDIGPRVEMYDLDRYFAVTGDHLAGTPEVVTPATEALAALHLEVFGQAKPTEPRPPRPVTTGLMLDRERVIGAIRASKQGPKFDRLMAGDISGYPGHSEADLGLCGILASWCNGDRSLMDAIYRESSLMRDKWDERRRDTTYGGMTIEKALSDVTWWYEWPPETRTGGDMPVAEVVPPELDDDFDQVETIIELERWKARALAAEAALVTARAEEAEAKAIIRGMRAAIANQTLGAAGGTGVALVFAVNTIPDAYQVVDQATGEIQDIPLRRPDGFVRVYLGHAPRKHRADPDAPPWQPPPNSLAARAGITPNTAGRHLQELQKAGIIEIDPASKTETWLRFRAPDHTRAPKVAEMLTTLAQAERTPEARHGDATRFASKPEKCPKCGRNLALHCPNPECDFVATSEPSHQDGWTPQPPTPLRGYRKPIHTQDGWTPPRHTPTEPPGFAQAFDTASAAMGAG